jgi:hypothetical protein
MRVFALRIERPFDVAVQRPQHPEPACIMKSRPLAAPIRSDGGLPFIEILLGLRQFHDVSAASRRVTGSRPSGSRRGSSKGRAQAATGFNCAISHPPSGMCSALNRRSLPSPQLPHFLGRLFRFPEPLTEFIQFGNLNKEIGGITGEN